MTDAALAERFGVSRRTIQRDTQALQERGIQRRRRRKSHRTQAHYAAIYRRFLTWLADEFGQPATRQDFSADVLARWIAHRGERQSARRREAIVGVAAVGMHRPAPTCPPRRPPRAGHQPACLPAAGIPAGDHSKLGDIIWSGDGQLPVQLKVAWGQGRVVKLTPQAAAVLTGWLPHHPDWAS